MKYCPGCGEVVTEDIFFAKEEGEEKVPKTVRKTRQKRRISKKIIMIVSVIVILFSGWLVYEKIIIPQQQKASTKWVGYKENGLIGFKDEKGNIKIKAKYINAGTFAENGLAAVVGENHLWGYINYKGKMVIEPQFESAKQFMDNGNACVWNNGKYEYIDGKGDYISECEMDDRASIIDTVTIDTTLRRTRDEKLGKYGYVDENGKYVIKPQFVGADEFAENGLAIVRDEKTKTYGYINEKGQYAIEPQFVQVDEFAENGLALVKDKNTEKYGYIDEKGQYVIKPQFVSASKFFGNGLANVKKDGGEDYFINALGDRVSLE